MSGKHRKTDDNTIAPIKGDLTDRDWFEPVVPADKNVSEEPKKP